MKSEQSKSELEEFSRRVGDVIDDVPALEKVLAENPRMMEKVLVDNRPMLSRLLSRAASEVLDKQIRREQDTVSDLASALTSRPAFLARLLTGTGA